MVRRRVEHRLVAESVMFRSISSLGRVLWHEYAFLPTAAVSDAILHELAYLTAGDIVVPVPLMLPP